MSPLHPDLGPGPDPLPVCVSCCKTQDDGILVRLQSSFFLCGTCAATAALDAFVEGMRLACAAAIEADPAMIYRRALP